MKLKNKGKVFPSPSPSSSSLSFDYVPGGDFLAVLNLLPAAILALASALSLQEREVLAYLITRSMNSVTPESKKISSKRAMGAGCGGGSGHNPPVFDCDCFDCYRCYWFRWDSSVNRELIHKAIEAFEDQLTSGEKLKKSTGRSKRRDRTVRRYPEKPASVQNQEIQESDESSGKPIPSGERIASSPPSSTGNAQGAETGNTIEKEEVPKPVEELIEELPEEEEDDGSDIVHTPSPGNDVRSVRKVLPDVLGLLNYRLWSLWSPQL